MEKRIPSPEELFGTTEEQIETVSVVRREPIPGYRVVNRHSVYVFLLLIILITALFLVNPLDLQYYYMNSSSMQNKIPEGSLLLVREGAAEDLKKGDVITFYNEEGISVTHEIVEVVEVSAGGRVEFKTKGTDNQLSDAELVAKEQVMGKVLFHIPHIGKVFSLFRK